MDTVIISNTTKNVVLGDRIAEAKGMFSRAKGLIGKTDLAEGEGLLLQRCGSIHTLGMKIAIDVMFLDVEMRIVKIIKRLSPNKISGCWNAAYVLELPVGTVDKSGSEIGDRVEVR